MALAQHPFIFLPKRQSTLEKYTFVLFPRTLRSNLVEMDSSACLTCSLTTQFIHFNSFVYVHLSLKPLSVKPSKAYSRGSVVMVDEIMNASPTKFRFPEAGLRVMVTSHFGPKTRLRMASRLIITEVRTEVPVVACPHLFIYYEKMWKIEQTNFTASLVR